MLIVGISTALKNDVTSIFVRSRAGYGDSTYQQLLTQPAYCQTDPNTDYNEVLEACNAKNSSLPKGSEYKYSIRWEVNYSNNGKSCTTSPVCVTVANNE